MIVNKEININAQNISNFLLKFQSHGMNQSIDRKKLIQILKDQKGLFKFNDLMATKFNLLISSDDYGSKTAKLTSIMVNFILVTPLNV